MTSPTNMFEWLKKIFGMDRKAAAPAPEVKPAEPAAPVETPPMTGSEEAAGEEMPEEEAPAETASEELK
jgi:hypothetical protein